MKRNVLLLMFSQALLVVCTSLLVASCPLVGLSLTKEKSLATLPLALLFLTRMAVIVPAALFMQKVGRRYGFMIAAVFGMVGALAATFGIHLGDFGLFCMGSILLGIPIAFGQFYRFAAAEVCMEEFRSRAISYVLAGGVIAALAGPNLARWSRLLFSHEFAGSYASLILLYLFSFIIATLLHIPQPAVFSQSPGGRPFLVIARQHTYRVAIISAAIGYGAMAFLMIATPLAMKAYAHPFADTAFVIQWHFFGMYAPSFFTGHLIRRYGLVNVMLSGILLMGLCIGINLIGSSVLHFWVSLLLLGVGWNFIFIGSTTLLTQTYTLSEKEKAQALNEFIVFGVVTLTSFSAGAVQYAWGWQAMNWVVVPFLVVIFIFNFWLRRSPCPPDTETEGSLSNFNG